MYSSDGTLQKVLTRIRDKQDTLLDSKASKLFSPGEIVLYSSVLDILAVLTEISFLLKEITERK